MHVRRARAALAMLGVVSGLSLPGESRAQQAPLYRVGDLNLALDDRGSDPIPLASAAGGTYFTATTPFFGRRPWSTDGTSAGTRRLMEALGRRSPDGDGLTDPRLPAAHSFHSKSSLTVSWSNL